MKQTPFSLPVFLSAIVVSIIPIFAQDTSVPSAEPVTKAYRVSPSFLGGLGSSPDAGAGAVDPFSAPTDSDKPPPPSELQTFLAEELQIPFPEGTFVRHDPQTGKLEIRHHPGVVEAIETYLRTMDDGYSNRQLNIRAEIYQMPALAALKVQQLCGPIDDHTSIYQNVHGMVERKQATLVTTISTIARSGQRARAEDMNEVIYATEIDWDKKEETVLPAGYETRNVGTIFEVDPVIGADDYTVDLNFSLEHHTSQPLMRQSSVTSPNTGHVVTVEMPEFHAKRITTQIAMAANSMKCIGAWRPTGKPEYAEADAMQVIFLRVDMQAMETLKPWEE